MGVPGTVEWLTRSSLVSQALARVLRRMPIYAIIMCWKCSKHVCTATGSYLGHARFCGKN